MRVLRFLLFIALSLLAVLIGMFVTAGLLTPDERNFVNEVEINAPAERVWHVITDKGKFTEWQDQLAKVEMVDEKTWVEYPKDSPEPLRFSLARDNRPSAMEFHYTMGDSFEGHWKGEITTSGSRVKVITTDGYKAKSWLTKILIYAFLTWTDLPGNGTAN
jgi:uncharacterized membrane protein